MYYPHFLEPHDTVGICAPSAGVGRNMALFEASLRILKEHDFQIYETAHVRVNDLRGGDATQRAAEVNALFYRDDVRVIMAAAIFFWKFYRFWIGKQLRKNRNGFWALRIRPAFCSRLRRFMTSRHCMVITPPPFNKPRLRPTRKTVFLFYRDGCRFSILQPCTQSAAVMRIPIAASIRRRITALPLKNCTCRDAVSAAV